MIIFLFFHILTCTNPMILLDDKLQALTFSLISQLFAYFKLLVLFISITSSHKYGNSNSNSNSFRVIIVKIIISKVNISKFDNTNANIKNLKKSESVSTKTMSSLESTASSGFASIFFIKNLSGTNYNAGRQASAALSYIYWVLYVSKQYFSIKVCKKTYQQLYHTFLEPSGTN